MVDDIDELEKYWIDVGLLTKTTRDNIKLLACSRPSIKVLLFSVGWHGKKRTVV